MCQRLASKHIIQHAPLVVGAAFALHKHSPYPAYHQEHASSLSKTRLAELSNSPQGHSSLSKRFSALPKQPKAATQVDVLNDEPCKLPPDISFNTLEAACKAALNWDSCHGLHTPCTIVLCGAGAGLKYQVVNWNEHIVWTSIEKRSFSGGASLERSFRLLSTLDGASVVDGISGDFKVVCSRLFDPGGCEFIIEGSGTRHNMGFSVAHGIPCVVIVRSDDGTVTLFDHERARQGKFFRLRQKREVVAQEDLKRMLSVGFGGTQILASSENQNQWFQVTKPTPMTIVHRSSIPRLPDVPGISSSVLEQAGQALLKCDTYEGKRTGALVIVAGSPEDIKYQPLDWDRHLEWSIHMERNLSRQWWSKLRKLFVVDGGAVLDGRTGQFVTVEACISQTEECPFLMEGKSSKYNLALALAHSYDCVSIVRSEDGSVTMFHPDFVKKAVAIRLRANLEPKRLPPLWPDRFLSKSVKLCGRDQFIKNLRDVLDNSESPSACHMVVINGEGGVGKTQVAMEYAQRFNSKYRSVIWLNAESALALSSDIRRFAISMGFKKPRGGMSEKNAIDQVMKFCNFSSLEAWLGAGMDSTASRILFIIDNVDDPTVLKDLNLATFGHVLITSRSGHKWNTHSGIAHVLDVPRFTAQETIRYLESNTDCGYDEVRQSVFCQNEDLYRLPWVLKHVVTYVNLTKCSLQKCLAEFEHICQARGAPIGKEDGHWPCGLLATCATELAVEQFKRQHSLYIDILEALAFIAPTCISFQILRVLTRAESDEYVLRGMSALQQCCILAGDHSSGSIHRLDQDNLRHLVFAHNATGNKSTEILERLLQSLTEVMPWDKREEEVQSAIAVNLAPHWLAVLRWALEDAKLEMEAARTAERLGTFYLESMQDPRLAEEFLEMDLHAIKRTHAHRITETQLKLVDCKRQIAKFNDAQQILLESKATLIDSGCFNGKIAGTIMRTRAHICHQLGQRDEERKCLKEALEFFKGAGTSNVREYARLLGSMAIMHDDDGELNEALAYANQAKDVYIKHGMRETNDCASLLRSTMWIMLHSNNLKGARKAVDESLQIHQNMGCVESINGASACRESARVSLLEQNFADALELANKSVKIYQDKGGSHTPGYASAKALQANAMFYLDQDIDDVLSAYLEAHDVYSQSGVKTHMFAELLRDIGDAQICKGNRQEALSSYAEALEILQWKYKRIFKDSLWTDLTMKLQILQRGSASTAIDATGVFRYSAKDEVLSRSLDHWVVPVQNGRNNNVRYSISGDGFSLAEGVETAMHTEQFYDPEHIEKVYVPEVEQFLKSYLGCSRVIVFDFKLRSTKNPFQLTEHFFEPRAAFAVHSDWTVRSGERHARDCLEEYVHSEDLDRLLRGHWCVFNIWRPLYPVKRSPLAVMRGLQLEDVQVVEHRADPESHTKRRFINRGGETYRIYGSSRHEWIYWPHMKPGEVLIFKTYDSKERPGFVPHSAFEDMTDLSEIDLKQHKIVLEGRFVHFNSREFNRFSIDTKAFVFFDADAKHIQVSTTYRAANFTGKCMTSAALEVMMPQKQDEW